MIPNFVYNAILNDGIIIKQNDGATIIRNNDKEIIINPILIINPYK